MNEKRLTEKILEVLTFHENLHRNEMRDLDKTREELTHRTVSDRKTADQLASNWADLETRYADSRGQWNAYRKAAVTLGIEVEKENQKENQKETRS
tara:strand:- start:563 stop:850 length:288 start_codon:yes stop_codon:yes gene_type:complete